MLNNVYTHTHTHTQTHTHIYIFCHDIAFITLFIILYLCTTDVNLF